MTIERTTITHSDSSRTVYEVDTDTGLLTIDGATMGEVQPGLLSELREADREQRQLERLDSNLQALKADTALQEAGRLTVSDFGPVSTTDLRQMALLVNQLRQQNLLMRRMILDTVRLVRGMAAEEGD